MRYPFQKMIKTTAKLTTLVVATQMAWGVSAQTVSPKLELGREVDSIQNIETLSEWTTLDTRRLTLRVNKSQNYLLTLQEHCEHLRGARLVGVSMSNQEIWADFDHIAADGYECRIDRINRLQN